MNRSAVFCLLALATSGCTIKNLEVHYEQVANCASWSEESDEASAAIRQPLVVFRIKSILNTSEKRVPSFVFDLRRVYWEGDRDHYLQKMDLPKLQPFILTLGSGEIRYVSSTGLFAIQLASEGIDEAALRNLVAQLEYNETSGLSVIMIRDDTTPEFLAFIGKTRLSGL